MAEQTPITLATLGALHAYRYGLTAHCRACGRHRPLDLGEMVGRLGANHPAVGRSLRLTCSGCRNRDVGVLVSAPDRGPAIHMGVAFRRDRP